MYQHFDTITFIILAGICLGVVKIVFGMIVFMWALSCFFMVCDVLRKMVALMWGVLTR